MTDDWELRVSTAWTAVPALDSTRRVTRAPSSSSRARCAFSATPGASIDLLTGWLADNEGHDLADSAKAFLALALTDAGRAVEAVTVALDALASSLPQYGGSIASYAEQLE